MSTARVIHTVPLNLLPDEHVSVCDCLMATTLTERRSKGNYGQPCSKCGAVIRLYRILTRDLVVRTDVSVEVCALERVSP